MRLPLAATLVTLITLSAHAADPAPNTLPPYTLTAPEPAHLQSTPILYLTVNAPPAQSAQPIRAAIIDLFHRISAAHVAPAAGPIIIFKSLGDGTTPVDIDVAIPVRTAPAAPPEGCQLRDLPSIPSLLALYKGKFSDFSTAFKDFLQQSQALNKPATGELRARVLYYESEISPNNVMMIEMKTAE